MKKKLYYYRKRKCLYISLNSFSPAIFILVTMETMFATITQLASTGRGEICGRTAEATSSKLVETSDNLDVFLGNMVQEILATKKNSSISVYKLNFLSTKIELIKAIVCRATESASLLVSYLSAGARIPLTANITSQKIWFISTAFYLFWLLFAKGRFLFCAEFSKNHLTVLNRIENSLAGLIGN